jgi:soluble lytic murein transglycosylase-like protein
MRPSEFLAYGLVLSLAASSAQAVVRVVVKGGKTLIYNDGVAEEAPGPARERVSSGWSVTRVAAPSQFDDLIASAAREHALDPKLLKSVMLFESGFNPKAVSRKGARGLMQLMPQTARMHGVRNMHDPAQNVQAGARHLSHLMDLYGGDLEKALAAYNAGEAAVERYGGVPPFDETRDYVRNILGTYYGRADLTGGFGKPAVSGRPVRVTRDASDRVVLTTAPPAPPRRLSS